MVSLTLTKQQLNYDALFESFKNRLQILNGPSEFLVSRDTYQFDDYSKYEASMFDEKHKSQVKAKQYPIDCKKAFEMGVRLSTIYCNKHLVNGHHD